MAERKGDWQGNSLGSQGKKDFCTDYLSDVHAKKKLGHGSSDIIGG